MSLFSERRNVETIPFLSRFCSVIIGGPSSSSHFLCCLARLLLSPHSCFFTHTHCFTVSRLVFYHPPSLYIPSSIHLSLSRSSLPPSLDLISQSAFYLSVFSHLVATAGKCKLCCFKYPCLPRAYSFRWAAGGRVSE